MKTTLKLVVAFFAIAIVFTGTAQEKFGGLALYTVRDEMAKDAKATLKAVADAGYKYVEAAGYENGKFYGMAPTEFKEELKSLGLTPISSHQGSVTLKNADTQIADVKAAGFKYFVIPVPPMGLFKEDSVTKKMGMTGGMKNLADILNTLGEKCSNAGLQLLYHNHDFEFVKDKDGNVPLDYLLENCSPKNVNFEIDLYWATKANVDPIAYFKKYPGRFKIWHVKDMDDQGQFAPVGKGNIDFTRIMANKKLSGMKYYMVEQDKTYNMTPLEAIVESHRALKKAGFN